MVGIDMKTSQKLLGNLYEYTALCSGCHKEANKKTVLVGITDIPNNPFVDNNEAMPVGWYSAGKDIYCPNCMENT